MRSPPWPTLHPYAARYATVLALGAAAAAAAMTVSGCEVEPAGDDFDVAYNGYLTQCKQCHAPGAPGGGGDEEKSLDFSDVATARATMRDGKATGLVGNTAACNGVPFVVAGKPEQSLIIAALDQDARTTFDFPSHPGCDNDAISDMALKVGSSPDPASLDALKAWIAAGAP